MAFLSTSLFTQPKNEGAQNKRIEEWEKKINEERQPPEKVIDAIGVKKGMKMPFPTSANVASRTTSRI